MSLGYEGVCRLIDQNDEIAIYAYSGADWSAPDYKTHARDLDGVIWINKRYLDAPEIRTKTGRRPSGKKYEILYKVTRFPDIEEHLRKGHIVIEPECKNAFRRGERDFDYIAYMLLRHIFTSYQENGVLPETECFIQ